MANNAPCIDFYCTKAVKKIRDFLSNLSSSITKETGWSRRIYAEMPASRQVCHPEGNRSAD
jgi:hypothetical protein